MEQRIRSRLVVHANWLMHDYKRHSRRKAAIYRTSGRVEYDEFYPREVKGDYQPD